MRLLPAHAGNAVVFGITGGCYVGLSLEPDAKMDAADLSAVSGRAGLVCRHVIPYAQFRTFKALLMHLHPLDPAVTNRPVG